MISDALRPLFAGYPVPSVRAYETQCVGGVSRWVQRQWPPADWALISVEHDEPPGGRSDLTWRTGDGRVVADEYKSGDRLSRGWETQITTQITTGLRTWGDAYTGIRLFVGGDPSASLWIPADNPTAITPLPATDMWFPRIGRT